MFICLLTYRSGLTTTWSLHSQYPQIFVEAILTTGRTSGDRQISSLIPATIIKPDRQTIWKLCKKRWAAAESSEQGILEFIQSKLAVFLVQHYDTGIESMLYSDSHVTPYITGVTHRSLSGSQGFTARSVDRDLKRVSNKKSAKEYVWSLTHDWQAKLTRCRNGYLEKLRRQKHLPNRYRNHNQNQQAKLLEFPFKFIAQIRQLPKRVSLIYYSLKQS